jgi:L-gulonolactone oxidase
MKKLQLFTPWIAVSILHAVVPSRAFGAMPFANFQGFIRCHPLEIVVPRTEADVQNAVRKAISLGLKVKAARKGFASSNQSSCVDDGGLQIDTTELKSIESVDITEKLVTVSPGITLWDLNQILHREHALTLPSVQEYGDVSIGGMIGNSTHGSTLAEASSSVHDRIVSVRLVDGSGEIRTISGADLDYVGGNLGVLGILTSVTMRVEDTFKVRAVMETHPDHDLESSILDRAASDYNVSVTWFPAQKTYTVLRFRKVSNDTPGEAHNGQVEVPWWKRKLFPIIFKLAQSIPGDRLSCFLEKQRFLMKSRGYMHDRFAHLASGAHGYAVGWSHEMINFVCRDRCPLADLPTSLEEVAIPLEMLPQFLTRVRELLSKAPTCLPLNGIYMRFGRASRGAISLAQGRDTVYVGVEFLEKRFGNGYEKNFEVVQEIEQMMLKEFSGRLHWGKNRDANFVDVREKFPRFEEFLAFRDYLDPNRIYVNKFFDTIRSSDLENALTDDCVAQHSCYCTEDRHCPRGYFCGYGRLNEDVRVCRKRVRRF